MNTANNYHKNFDFSFKLKEAVRHSPHHNAKSASLLLPTRCLCWIR